MCFLQVWWQEGVWTKHQCFLYLWSLLWHLQIPEHHIHLPPSKWVTLSHVCIKRKSCRFYRVMGFPLVTLTAHLVACEGSLAQLQCGNYFFALMVDVMEHQTSKSLLRCCLLLANCSFCLTDQGQVISVNATNYGRRDQTTCVYQRPLYQIRNNGCVSPTHKVAARYSCTTFAKCIIKMISKTLSNWHRLVQMIWHSCKVPSVSWKVKLTGCYLRRREAFRMHKLFKA